MCARLRAHNLTLAVFSTVVQSCSMLFTFHSAHCAYVLLRFWNDSGSGQTDIDTDLVSSFMLAFFVVVAAFQLWGCQLMMVVHVWWWLCRLKCHTRFSLALNHIHVCAIEAPTRSNVFNFSLMNSPQIFRAYFNVKGWQIPWLSWCCYEQLSKMLNLANMCLLSKELDSKWSFRWVTIFYLRLTP